MVPKVSENRMLSIIDQLTAYTSSKDEQLRDIANLGIVLLPLKSRKL